MLKIDPTISINSELIFAEALANFQKKHGTASRHRFGDTILPPNPNADQMFEAIIRHYARIKDEKGGV